MCGRGTCMTEGYVWQGDMCGRGRCARNASPSIL